MKVVVTGAGGFIGTQLVRELCQRGTLALRPSGEVGISSIVAADLSIPEQSRQGLPDWVSFVEADLSTDEAVDSIIPKEEDFLLFHLAAIVSGDGERDFDLCIRVNLEGTAKLLEACRYSRTGPCRLREQPGRLRWRVLPACGR